MNIASDFGVDFDVEDTTNGVVFPAETVAQFGGSRYCNAHKY